ncbi:MAG: ABC transporter ATP-binding protein [Ruminococcus sp.]|nr:ABC transporter ATP-binding protein [Ruminococcus sp.]
MLGEVAADLSQPKLMSKIVDEGVLGSDMSLILHTGILMLVLLILGACCGSASAAFAGVASQGFSRDVRNDLFRRVMGLSFQQTDKFTTGSLVTRLTADITAVQQMVDYLIRGFVRNIIMFSGGIYMMMKLDVKFGLVIAIALPLEALIVIMIMRHANPLYGIVAQRLDSVNSVMQENVTGARVIKAYVREKHEAERFGTANSSLMEANLKVLKLMALMQPVLLIIMNISVLFVIYLGGWQVEAAEMQVGEVMAAVTYLTQVLHGIMMLSMMFQTISKAAASAKRIGEVLESEPVITDGKGTDAERKGSVTFRNVTFAYPTSSGLPVLSGISLDIKQGERVAVIGATGSGKSTLAALIPRFYDPDEGEVLIDGVNAKEYKLEDLRKRVGIVLQKSELFSGTAADNIRWGGKDASDDEVRAAAETAQADEFLSRMPEGYDTVIAEKGASLSGGQKQRLSITRAVLSKPEILIFDDSTSALDLSTEAKLLNGLKEKMQGTTVIMIAQRIAGIKDFDRIAVLDHGRLVGCDTHEKLLESCDVYKDIYSSQMRTKGGEENAAAAADRT